MEVTFNASVAVRADCLLGNHEATLMPSTVGPSASRDNGKEEASVVKAVEALQVTIELASRAYYHSIAPLLFATEAS